MTSTSWNKSDAKRRQLLFGWVPHLQTTKPEAQESWERACAMTGNRRAEFRACALDTFILRMASLTMSVPLESSTSTSPRNCRIVAVTHTENNLYQRRRFFWFIGRWYFFWGGEELCVDNPENLSCPRKLKTAGQGKFENGDNGANVSQTQYESRLHFRDNDRPKTERTLQL